MKSGKAIALIAGVAVIVGAGFWINREREASACRESAVRAGATFPAYGGNVEAALSMIAYRSRREAEDCYRRGLLTTPEG